LNLTSEDTEKGRVYRIKDGKAASSASDRVKQAADAMQKKRRNGRASTETSVEDEISHLRGLDSRGLRARWQSVFQRPAPAHLTRHLLFAIIAYRIKLIGLAISITKPSRCWIERLRRKLDRQCPLVWQL